MTATTPGTVLVIGGGHPQLCLIEALRDLGEHVVALDDRPHVPAHRAAHEVVPIHRYDLDAIVAHTRANPPDHVASGGSDRAVHIAAHLAETMGLPTYVSTAVAELPMRKAVSRQLLAAVGVACPATVYGADLETFQRLDWNRFSFPVVVKPDQGIGQTAVDRAENPEQALSSIAAALQVTGNGLAVVQELVAGEEIGVNGLALDGRFHLLTTSYRRSSRQRGQEFGVAMEKVYPAVTDPRGINALRAIIQRACVALGVDNGPIYAQVIMTTNPGREPAFTIIEIMPRLGGGEDPRLVYAATGINLAKATALLWLGRRVTLDDLREGTPHRKVVLRFLRAHPGQITTITGLDDARAVPGILAADVFVLPGQHLAALSSSRERTGYVLAAGVDPDTAANQAEATIIIQTGYTDRSGGRAPDATTRPRAREMPIYKRYFDLIASGAKTIEVRVAYPSNQRLAAGGLIRFVCRGEECLTRITRIATYRSFDDLFTHEDPVKVNPTAGREEQLVNVRLIYPTEKEALGVMAIEVERC